MSTQLDTFIEKDWIEQSTKKESELRPYKEFVLCTFLPKVHFHLCSVYVFVCSFFRTNIKGLRQLNDVSKENSLKDALGANLDEKRSIPILP